MTGDQLYARMLGLSQRYKEAKEADKLGAAGVAREEAGQLLVENWESVLAALELWAFPMSYGVEEGMPHNEQHDDPRSNDDIADQYEYGD